MGSAEESNDAKIAMTGKAITVPRTTGQICALRFGLRDGCPEGRRRFCATKPSGRAITLRGEYEHVMPLTQPVDQGGSLALVTAERDGRVEVADYEDPHGQKTSNRCTFGLLSRPIGPRSRLGNWVA